MKIALIIPTLNEHDSLPMLFDELNPVYHELKDKGHKLEIIIVDDDSNDGTPIYVQECINKAILPLKLIKRKERGLATAVIRGFNETAAEILCVMDADLSHPPNLILTLVENAKTFDLVLPCRNMTDGGAEKWPIHRKFISILATKLVKFVGVKVRDPLSGYFLIHRSVIDKVELLPVGYKILLEILVKGKIQNYIEVPYIFRNRTVGNSKMSNKIIWQYLKHLWMLKKWQKKRIT